MLSAASYLAMSRNPAQLLSGHSFTQTCGQIRLKTGIEMNRIEVSTLTDVVGHAISPVKAKLVPMAVHFEMSNIWRNGLSDKSLLKRYLTCYVHILNSSDLSSPA